MMVRMAGSGDLFKAHSLINRNLDDSFNLDVIRFFFTQWPEGQFVAEDLLGNIMGVICGSRLNPHTASISLFAVENGFRGRGVGTSLFETFRRRCFMEGVSMIQLEVRTTNDSAIRFYRNRGFVVAEEVPALYSDGGDAYRMRLDLSGLTRSSS